MSSTIRKFVVLISCLLLIGIVLWIYRTHLVRASDRVLWQAREDGIQVKLFDFEDRSINMIPVDSSSQSSFRQLNNVTDVDVYGKGQELSVEMISRLKQLKGLKSITLKLVPMSERLRTWIFESQASILDYSNDTVDFTEISQSLPPELKSLMLEGRHLGAEPLGRAEVNRDVSLVTCSLQGFNLESFDMEYLKVVAPKRLVLTGVLITDKGVEGLAKVSSIQALYLNDCTFSGSSLQSLKHDRVSFLHIRVPTEQLIQAAESWEFPRLEELSIGSECSDSCFGLLCERFPKASIICPVSKLSSKSAALLLERWGDSFLNLEEIEIEAATSEQLNPNPNISILRIGIDHITAARLEFLSEVCPNITELQLSSSNKDKIAESVMLKAIDDSFRNLESISLNGTFSKEFVESCKQRITLADSLFYVD